MPRRKTKETISEYDLSRIERQAGLLDAALSAAQMALTPLSCESL